MGTDGVSRGHTRWSPGLPSKRVGPGLVGHSRTRTGDRPTSGWSVQVVVTSYLIEGSPDSSSGGSNGNGVATVGVVDQ